MGSEITEGEGVQLTIDTQSDTYEQAIAAVQPRTDSTLLLWRAVGRMPPSWRPGRTRRA